MAVYTDITEDQRREEEMRAAKESAERALQELTQTQQSLVHAEKMAALGQLTAGIAHEIKNPLNFVNNFADSSGELLDELVEVLNPSLGALDEEKREDVKDQMDSLRNFLSKIKQHGQRADGIVRSMLAHAREAEDAASSTDLNALLEETLNLAYHGARAEHQSFNVSLERDLDPDVGEVQLYPQAFTRVVLNLLNNSFYATYERKIQSNDTDYSPTVKVSTRDLGQKVEARVWDNGTGIPQDTVEKVFDPFYTSKPAGEGTGLGLSMSYETVVQQHHGRLEVDTKEGEYTEFIITLPRQAVAATGAGGRA